MKIVVVKDRNVAETKFLAQFVNSLACCGHELYVLCDSFKEPDNSELIKDDIELINLSKNKKKKFSNIFTYIEKYIIFAPYRYFKEIKKINPDVVICYFLVDLFNVSFFNRKKIPVVMMFHNYPPAVFEKINKRNFIFKKLYKKFLDQCSAIQVLNEGFRQYIHKYCQPKSVVAIPNAVEQIPDDQIADLNFEKKKIIYVARLSRKGKRQHLLIDAFAQISDQFPDWTLEFWGLEKHAAYKKELLKKISNLGLQERVFLRGYSRSIADVYRSADINAFPSLREGFGLALADGMAMGLPSLGFAGAPSVNELIRHNENGLLADDLNDFSEKLGLLMSDKNLRIRLGQQAKEDMKKFSPEIILQKWDSLLAHVAGDK